METTNKNLVPIKDVMTLLTPYGPKTQQIISSYCRDGGIPAQMIDGCWYIDIDYVYQSIEWRKSVNSLDVIIESTPRYNDLSKCAIELCRRSIRRKIGTYLAENKYGRMFAGNLIPAGSFDAVKSVVDAEIEAYYQKTELKSIKDASEILGISDYKLKKLIDDGAINGVRVSNNWYVAGKDLDSYVDKRDNLIGIHDLITDLVHGMTTIFDPDNQSHRHSLRDFLRKSKYFNYLVTWEQSGLYGDRRNTFYVPKDIVADVTASLTDFLKHFGKVADRIKLLLADKYWTTHPKTLEAVNAFSPGKVRPGLVALMEMIIETMEPEIMDATDDELEKLISYASSASLQIYGKYAAMFVAYIREHYKCSFTLRLTVDWNDEKHNAVNTDEYTFTEYMLGGYMALNDDYINNHNLIAKALANGKHALMWLHMIFQYTSAWRNGDFFSMPLIPLLHDNDTVRHMITSGTYDNEAVTISLLLEREINGRYTLPHKTQERQNQDFLVVVFPESLRKIIGTVYSICYLHSDGLSFHPQKFRPKDYIEFFGEDYQNIFGRTAFLNRRANKSFMGYLYDNSTDGTGKKNHLMGYSIASLARAHTTGDGKLSATTFKYLRTIMDGYTPDQILHHLYETGSCSFVPYMLFETVYGDTFHTLTFDQQNEIIKISGLSALAAENTSAMLQSTYIHATITLNNLFRGYGEEDIKTVANKMLLSIINKEALGKHMGVSCLQTARGYPCVCSEKEDCLGCQYAIYERSLLFLGIERVRLKYAELKSARTEGDRRKIAGILEHVYLPAVCEILFFAKQHYNMDITPYKEELLKLITGGNLNVEYHD